MRRLSLVFAVAACGGGSSAGPDASGQGDAAADAPACVRMPAAADRVRHVVISHPYDASSNQANAWEVLDLAADGTLTRPNTTFTMGRALDGEVAFTPDGAIGIAVQDDGSLGVFALADDGTPTVLEATFHGSFYAGRVIMAPSGDHAYVLDDEWRENGGGIYQLDIGCDGTVTEHGLVAASRLPAALAFVPGTGQAVLAAQDIGSSAAGADAHLLTWDGAAGSAPSLVASSDAFGDDMAIVGGGTLTDDGKFFLIGDTSQFANVPNRVAVVPVDAAALGTPYVIADVMDPLALVASPFTEDVLVVSGFGDAFYVLHRDTDGVWKNTGEPTYQGASPQLPGGAVRIDAGTLRGTVLVSENVGVRRVELGASGFVDHGMFALGSGLENIVGAIGVTP